MISASLAGVNVYEVIVGSEPETAHQVTLTPEYYRQLCNGTVTHEWLLIQAFRFLLEREPNTAILSEFDLRDVSRYFPEFEDEMALRLGARS